MNRKVAELFRLLMDLSPEDRARYRADHAIDAYTRREVEELLAHDSRGDDRISKLVRWAAMAVLGGDMVGLRCGPFRLMSVIGRGGMGAVYLAERSDGEVSQRAAVKLMQPGFESVALGRSMHGQDCRSGGRQMVLPQLHPTEQLPPGVRALSH